MVDEPENLVLRYLRAIDAKVDELKTTQAGILQILTAHNGRLLRIEERLDRIDKRLELVEQIPNAVNFTGSVDN